MCERRGDVPYMVLPDKGKLIMTTIYNRRAVYKSEDQFLFCKEITRLSII